MDIGEGLKVIPFPINIVYEPPVGATRCLEVVEGDVDPITFEMLPGAHVILHIYENDIPLLRYQGSDASDEPVDYISIAKIEFCP